MTDAIDTALSGEARLKAQRNRFWSFCAAGLAVAVAVGFGTGWVSDLFLQGKLPGWSMYLAWGLALTSFAWFTRIYFRRVDELDLLDNLWACMIGFYFYAIAMPSWWLFASLGLAPEVNHIMIYLAAFVITFAAYGFRKLGLR